MEPLHIEVLKKYFDILIKSIKVREVIPCLVSGEVIPNRYLERANSLLENHGQTEAAEYIMKELLIRDPDPATFDKLLYALRESNDAYLADHMHSDYHVLLRKAGHIRQGQHGEPGSQACQASASPPQAELAKMYRDTPLKSINFDIRDRSVPCVPLDELNVGQRITRTESGILYNGRFNGTEVAVKEIPLNIKRRRGKTVEELSREQVNDEELQANVFVRHANVILLMAFSIKSESLYLVFEFIHGDNLEQITFFDETRKSYGLTMFDKFNLTTQISRAVAYLHLCNPLVVHGDIKPANMMVTRDKSQAKLCDLGIVKLKSKNAMTTTGGHNVVGTTEYMAPEVLLQHKSATEKSDVWSLVTSLYEIFFEQHIWQLVNSATIKRKLQSKCKPDLVENPVSRAEGISKLIEKFMVHDDQSRPTSLDLLKELTHLESLFARNQRRDN